MNLADILQVELDSQSRFTPNLTLVEVGTIRNSDPASEEADGWSTVTFANYLKVVRGGSLISIDLKVSVADDLLKFLGLREYVDLREVEGSLELERLIAANHRPNLILLDGSNDPAETLRQFELACRMVAAYGVILIDDSDPKAELVLVELARAEIPFELKERTSDSYTTSVVIVRGSAARDRYCDSLAASRFPAGLPEPSSGIGRREAAILPDA